MPSSVDWSVPQPSYEELYAKHEAALDALAVERNAAVAEAKLWLRRLQEAQAERDQAKAELRETDALLDSWQAAHAELLQSLRRLEVEASHLRFDRDIADGVIAATQHVVDFLIEQRAS